MAGVRRQVVSASTWGIVARCPAATLPACYLRRLPGASQARLASVPLVAAVGSDRGGRRRPCNPCRTVHVTRRGHRTGVDDLEAADGWTYHYIHVNNDTPGTDDGKATRAQAFPANIVAGAKVTKVQVVGYMGDSGNAESTAPHLHFEIRQPAVPGSYQGTAINAYPSLQQATHWNQTSRWDLRRTATAGPSDEQFTYGMQAGDRGLLCDWDGDGRRRGRDLPCRHLAPPRQHQRRCHRPGPPLPPSPSARRATSRSWATAPTR